MPEPFRWTISLVELSDASSDLETRPEAQQAVAQSMPLATSEHQETVPLQPAVTALRSDSPPQNSAGETRTSLTSEIAPSSEPRITSVEPVRPQETAQEHPILTAIEPAMTASPPIPDPLPIPQEPRPSLSAKAPGDASPPVPTKTVEAIPPISTAATTNHPPPPRAIVDRLPPPPDYGVSSTSEQAASAQPIGDRPDPSRTEPPAPSASTRADYGWLQQALSRRLEELKRSSRPFMQESGRLRVLLKAVISNAGELMEAEIITSSGHHSIDREAMTLVQRAFPMSLDHNLDRAQVVMRIPITFSRD